MILQPVLKGQLLELRPLRPEDFEDLYAVASDPLIWEQHPHKNRYQVDVFREFFRQGLASGGALIVVDSKNSKVIGSSRYRLWRCGLFCLPDHREGVGTAGPG
jgi:RimJ/RimL family protein N-acetyltransferase